VFPDLRKQTIAVDLVVLSDISSTTVRRRPNPRLVRKKRQTYPLGSRFAPGGWVIAFAGGIINIDPTTTPTATSDVNMCLCDNVRLNT